MKIRLSEAGKRFNRDWIFRKADFHFESPHSYAITGPNGSGKSTLLQSIGSIIQLSEGKIQYENATGFIQPEDIFRSISFCAPYLELVEELTLPEYLQFHQQFKPFYPDISQEEIITIIGLQQSVHKQIRNFSSGMKQRVKLAQAIFSDTPVLLLDEPCTNLDAAGISLYQQLMTTYGTKRIVIVSSNDPVEYRFCTHVMSVEQWKV